MALQRPPSAPEHARDAGRHVGAACLGQSANRPRGPRWPATQALWYFDRAQVRVPAIARPVALRPIADGQVERVAEHLHVETCVAGSGVVHYCTAFGGRGLCKARGPLGRCGPIGGGGGGPPCQPFGADRAYTGGQFGRGRWPWPLVSDRNRRRSADAASHRRAPLTAPREIPSAAAWAHPSTATPSQRFPSPPAAGHTS